MSEQLLTTEDTEDRMRVGQVARCVSGFQVSDQSQNPDAALAAMSSASPG
jgi:hypothetical protein